jgi:hypothetical protein
MERNIRDVHSCVYEDYLLLPSVCVGCLTTPSELYTNDKQKGFGRKHEPRVLPT